MKTLYVIVNGALEMSPGKVASQVAHAVAKLTATDPYICDKVRELGMNDPSKVVVLRAQDGEQMYYLRSYLENKRVGVGMYVDEGSHETPPFYATCMAIEPVDTSDMRLGEEVEELLKDFPLYGKKKRWWDLW